MRRVRAAALAAGVTILGACSDSPTEVQFQVIEEVTFDPSLGIDLAEYTQIAEGVYIRDLTMGTGTVLEAASEVTMNYTGWLTDGTQFDTQDDYFFIYLVQPYRFVPGFEIGIDAMAQGGTRRIIIPPALAYGAQGANHPQTGQVVIPPGAVVIFEVEFVTVTAP